MSHLFERATARKAKPRELALLEIAIGWAKPCADEDEFVGRCKRWNKVRLK